MSMNQYTIPQFIVDAFTDTVFKGNPAAVCLLDEWLSDDTLQNIAKENNLSETAFTVKNGVHYELRWPLNAEINISSAGLPPKEKSICVAMLPWQRPLFSFDLLKRMLKV